MFLIEYSDIVLRFLKFQYIIVKQDKMKKILVITYALDDEVDILTLEHIKDECQEKWLNGLRPLKRFFQNHTNIKDREVVFVRTGVGKVASYQMLRMVFDLTKKYTGGDAEVTVLNIGTAASVLEDPGILVNPSRFIDRDLIKIGGGYIDKIEYQIGPDTAEGNRAYSCNSGDTFVTCEGDAWQMDDGFVAVCDMEAFQQALLCDLYNGFTVEFHCWKFITDKIGENSLGNWKEMLPEAREELTVIAMDFIEDFYRS